MAETSSIGSSTARPLAVRRPGRIPYGEGLRLQAELVEERKAGRVPDHLLLLEHPHVITRGTSTDDAHVLADASERERLDVELFDAGRGGDVTYHGPGQLVGYPILDLRPDRKDLHRYLRDLETVLIRTLEGYGVRGRRVDGYTGVWVEDRKIAAIGVRVSSPWITSHGFALNVTTDLSYFGTIVPCGIPDREVTSLAREVEGAPGEAVSVDGVGRRLVPVFEDVFGRNVVSSSEQFDAGEGA